MILLPVFIIGLSIALAIPLGRYLAIVLDRDGPRNAIERMLDTGPQTWKQYVYTMLSSNTALFLVGFAVLATQPWHPAFLNPDGKGMLAPTTIFNTAASFLTNTNLQHSSGEVHLTYGSQLFAIMLKQFLTPAIGLAALLAVIRGLRGDANMGNYTLDVWRGVIYVALPPRSSSAFCSSPAARR
jgi:K+-transporting ATPase ATPase A chain